MNIVVAGGTGFIGKKLVERLLNAGHAVVVFSRHPAKMSMEHPHLTVETWDAKSLGQWSKHVDGADAVVNLTGELIAGKRWTQRQKMAILNSRVESTKILVDAMRLSSKKPSLLMNMSGVGYYGNVPGGEVSEASSSGKDFLAHVCQQWEEAALKAAEFGVRVATPRLAVVLGDDGGAFQRLSLPFKFFSGGYLGTGKQWFPWVHRDDVINALVFVLEHPSVKGAVNLAAPEAVTMKSFCAILGRVMSRPSWTFVPSFVLRTALGEMAEMLLTGQRAIPKKLLEAGFTFQYPLLEQALTSILRK